MLSHSNKHGVFSVLLMFIPNFIIKSFQLLLFLGHSISHAICFIYFVLFVLSIFSYLI